MGNRGQFIDRAEEEARVAAQKPQVWRVTCIATVRKVYEIEAKDEIEAVETAALNEPVDEIEVHNELCTVEIVKD